MSIYIIGFGIFCSVLLNIALWFKRNTDSLEFGLVSYMAKLNLVGVILELASLLVVRMSNSSLLLSSLVVRFYLLYLMSFLLLFTLYLYTISYKIAENKKEKYYKVLSKIVFFIFYIAAAVMIFVPIKIYNGYASGQAFDYVYLCSIITMSAWIISIVKNIGKVDKKKFIPLGVFILLTSLSLVSQRLNHSLNLMASLQVVIMFSFLLTIKRKHTNNVQKRVANGSGEQFYLPGLLDEISYQTKNRLAEKTIQFKEIFDENLPKYLCGNPQVLKQICLNILSCSIENTTIGTVEFKVDSILRDQVCKLVIIINASGLDNSAYDSFAGQMEMQDEGLPMVREISETKRLIDDLGGKFVIQYGQGTETTFIIAVEQHMAKS